MDPNQGCTPDSHVWRFGTPLSGDALIVFYNLYDRTTHGHPSANIFNTCQTDTGTKSNSTSTQVAQGDWTKNDLYVGYSPIGVKNTTERLSNSSTDIV